MIIVASSTILKMREWCTKEYNKSKTASYLAVRVRTVPSKRVDGGFVSVDMALSDS